MDAPRRRNPCGRCPAARARARNPEAVRDTPARRQVRAQEPRPAAAQQAHPPRRHGAAVPPPFALHDAHRGRWEREAVPAQPARRRPEAAEPVRSMQTARREPEQPGQPEQQVRQAPPAGAGAPARLSVRHPRSPCWRPPWAPFWLKSLPTRARSWRAVPIQVQVLRALWREREQAPPLRALPASPPVQWLPLLEARLASVQPVRQARPG